MKAVWADILVHICIYTYIHTREWNGRAERLHCKAEECSECICNWGKTLSKAACLFQRSGWGKRHLKWQQQCRLWNCSIAAYRLCFEGLFVVWCFVCMDLWEREMKGTLCFQVKTVFLSRGLLVKGKENVPGVVLVRYQREPAWCTVPRCMLWPLNYFLSLHPEWWMWLSGLSLSFSDAGILGCISRYTAVRLSEDLSHQWELLVVDHL